MLALRLPPDLERRLDALAKRTGRSKSFYAREAIIEAGERAPEQPYPDSLDLEAGSGVGPNPHVD